MTRLEIMGVKPGLIPGDHNGLRGVIICKNKGEELCENVPLWSGLGKVAPSRTSPTQHSLTPSIPTRLNFDQISGYSMELLAEHLRA